MMFGHIGLAVSIIGIAMVQNYSIERDVRLAPGQSYSIQGYDFYFKGLKDKNGPNYDGFVMSLRLATKGNT